MDPNKVDDEETTIKNAELMFKIGFGVPLMWLICFVYSYINRDVGRKMLVLSKRSFFLFFLALFIFGSWTALYSAFWDKIYVIGFNYPRGEPKTTY